MPDSRKERMFEIRRREEADGETRIIGSGLRAGTLGLCGSVVLLAAVAAA
jgi:hypothetical protein